MTCTKTHSHTHEHFTHADTRTSCWFSAPLLSLVRASRQILRFEKFKENLSFWQNLPFELELYRNGDLRVEEENLLSIEIFKKSVWFELAKLWIFKALYSKSLIIVYELDPLELNGGVQSFFFIRVLSLCLGFVRTSSDGFWGRRKTVPAYLKPSNRPCELISQTWPTLISFVVPSAQRIALEYRLSYFHREKGRNPLHRNKTRDGGRKHILFVPFLVYVYPVWWNPEKVQFFALSFVRKKI